MLITPPPTSVPPTRIYPLADPVEVGGLHLWIDDLQMEGLVAPLFIDGVDRPQVANSYASAAALAQARSVELQQAHAVRQATDGMFLVQPLSFRRELLPNAPFAPANLTTYNGMHEARSASRLPYNDIVGMFDRGLSVDLRADQVARIVGTKG